MNALGDQTSAHVVEPPIRRSSPARQTRLTIVCLEPVLAPYSIPRLRALQGLRRNDAVHAVALGATERIREWHVEKAQLGFGYAELFPGKTIGELASRALAERVTSLLDEYRPDIVLVTGYYYAAMRAATRWAKRHGKGSVFLGDSHRADRRRLFVKEWVKGWWVRRHYDSAFAAGVRTATYLMGLGIPRQRIWTGYDVVDNEAFAAAAQAARSQGDSLRRRLGVPDRHFLFVGRLAPEKNVARLLAAYRRYRSITGRNAWGLVLVGSGPLESELRTLAAGLDDVVFAGFQKADAVAAYYGTASCLVLPSVRETWGLVVNEAMAAGLPVLVSQRCGCVPELVSQGENGYLFDPLDVGNLARLMGQLSSESMEVKRMGDASRRIVNLFTPETWAWTLSDCIERTLEAIGSRRLSGVESPV